MKYKHINYIIITTIIIYGGVIQSAIHRISTSELFARTEILGYKIPDSVKRNIKSAVSLHSEQWETWKGVLENSAAMLLESASVKNPTLYTDMKSVLGGPTLDLPSDLEDAEPPWETFMLMLYLMDCTDAVSVLASMLPLPTEFAAEITLNHARRGDTFMQGEHRVGGMHIIGTTAVTTVSTLTLNQDQKSTPTRSITTEISSSNNVATYPSTVTIFESSVYSGPIYERPISFIVETPGDVGPPINREQSSATTCVFHLPYCFVYTLASMVLGVSAYVFI